MKTDTCKQSLLQTSTHVHRTKSRLAMSNTNKYKKNAKSQHVILAK